MTTKKKPAAKKKTAIKKKTAAKKKSVPTPEVEKPNTVSIDKLPIGTVVFIAFRSEAKGGSSRFFGSALLIMGVPTAPAELLEIAEKKAREKCGNTRIALTAMNVLFGGAL